MRFVLLLAVLLGLCWLGLRVLPPEWDPRTPLDLRAAPNLLTPLKLARLSRNSTACFAAFEASGINPIRVPDRPSNLGCAVEDAVRLPGPVAANPAAPAVTCRVAAAWVLWERHGLQPAARRHLDSEVASVRHLGTWNCRNVNNAASGRRSEHATANAIDIASFRLVDGREVTLLRGWSGPPEQAGFLRAARDNACRFFSVVLGPDRDAAHRDHFHLDMGPWRACR
ncbi:extensin-like domain-containing protein [Sabulicella glaciei]|uniref:Extensin family protein n=1 Tax=Sabulicella glaciei TaxID=2984948 RepID=A0ABT3NRK0_9PROT|nr:extensin family protein [Roseococcus sp. MDT2-1-1]MCW8084767.1 extensin family protein [Roseococcus sp. MDT2-1-1]